MSQATLLFDATFATASAALYAYVARLVQARATPDADARLANRMFVVWWVGLAAVTALGALRSALVAFGVVDLGLHVGISLLGVVPLVALLWGLVYYLTYIYTGNPRTFWPITIFHGAILAFFVGLTIYLQPAGLAIREWSVGFTYAREVGGVLVALTLFSILGPTLLAAIGYGTLYFRTEDRTARYRIALVSGGFILWFGSSSVAAAIPAIAQWSYWPLASRVIALMATLMILAAFQPPGFLRARFGVRPYVMRPGQEREDEGRRLRPFPTAVRASGT